MDNREETCFGCGVVPVVEVNDRKLCGNCFLLGISVSIRPGSNGNEAPQSHNPGDARHVQELHSTLLTAIDEIHRLRDRLDELARENDRLKNDD